VATAKVPLLCTPAQFVVVAKPELRILLEWRMNADELVLQVIRVGE
jgi:hypothetical protein